MTAEIAIMNQFGIALAADSAITIGGQRVWNTASKLFSLGPYNDIGVMVYGGGDHAGLPWETLVKDWRKTVNRRKFSTVCDAATDLEDYLKRDFNISDSRKFLEAGSFIVDAIESISNVTVGITKPQRKKNLNAILDNLVNATDSPEEFGFDLPIEKFIEEYAHIIDDLANDILKFNISEALLSKIVWYCYDRCKRKIASNRHSGLVLAGFGEEELLPYLIEIRVDGRLGEHPRIWRVRERNVRDRSALIIPFADKDEAVTFMEGMSPELNHFTEAYFRRIIESKSEQIVRMSSANDDERKVERSLQKLENKKIMDGFSASFDKHKKEKFVDPSLDVVQSLPKEEMASMAEALVETASLRKKVGPLLETVGGPIDVAVISKGDGFIWVKRKHYFDAAINPSFLVRKAAIGDNTPRPEALHGNGTD